MQLFEKIFQRDDKIFIQIYFFFLGIFLYLCSMTSYYLLNKTFRLPEIYVTSSILVVIIFWIAALIRLQENRYVIGTVQFLKVEFIVLIQTFLAGILLTALLKVTGQYSRVWLITTFILSFVGLIILKVIFDQLYYYLISSNIIQRNVLLVGDSSSCQNIIKKFPKKISNSIIKCLITIDSEEHDSYYYEIPRFKLSDDLTYILNHHLIGQIWIVSVVKTQSYIEQLVDKFLEFPVDCRLISPESKFKFIEGLDSEAGFDFYNISFSPFHGSKLLIKNLLDKIFSLLFLFLTLPLIFVSAVLIFVQDGFPIFFKQKRTGWDGKSFYIYKFRTLSKSNLNNISKTKQVVTGDKRITKVGFILRRFSIDELPQFINVLKGDMSIIGPRPHMLEHTQYYSEEILNFMQRHKCPPGLSGWAQINGFRGPTQNKELMNRRFQYDLYYIKNWSLILDFYIIIRTILVVLFQKVD